jgi:hypothetical protein
VPYLLLLDSRAPELRQASANRHKMAVSYNVFIIHPALSLSLAQVPRVVKVGTLGKNALEYLLREFFVAQDEHSFAEGEARAWKNDPACL